MYRDLKGIEQVRQSPRQVEKKKEKDPIPPVTLIFLQNHYYLLTVLIGFETISFAFLAFAIIKKFPICWSYSSGGFLSTKPRTG
jgi:hypothetical protein